MRRAAALAVAVCFFGCAGMRRAITPTEALGVCAAAVAAQGAVTQTGQPSPYAPAAPWVAVAACAASAAYVYTWAPPSLPPSLPRN